MSLPSVLYVDIAGYQPLPSRDVLSVAGEGSQIHAVVDVSAALAAVDTIDNLKVVMANAPVAEIYRAARKNHPAARTILLTQYPMKEYSRQLNGHEDDLIDHVIANRPASEWTINEVRVTLQKVVRADFFGIEKYLALGSKIFEITITGSEDREQHNTTVMKYAEDCRLGTHFAKMIYGICEELLMNVVYDAPLASGKHHYNELPRSTAIKLEPNEYAKLTYGCDGQVFALGAADPFGLFTQAKLYKYVRKVLKRSDSDSIVDDKKGGAGLGLFKILYSCHSLVCNVEPNKKTETIALISVGEQLRDFEKMARSIHYFLVK